MSAYIFDTETTGKEDTSEIIEAAYIRLEPTDGARFFIRGSEFSQRYKPSTPISFGAMATHNIIDSDLDACQPSSSFALPGDTEYLIGHNVDYDWSVAGKPDVKRIDTLALTRNFWRDSDSHSQMSCMYRIDPVAAQSMAKTAHGALADVGMCATILELIVDEWHITSFDMLYKLSELARIPETISFGKHEGSKVKDIPVDYKQWYMRQTDTDKYLVMAMSGKTGLTNEIIEKLRLGENPFAFYLTSVATPEITNVFKTNVR